MTATLAPIIRENRTSRLPALLALFTLTIRQHTHGRRLYVIAGLYAIPCILALVLRNLPGSAPADALEMALIFSLLPHGLAPLTALLYASGVISDEIEEQTLTYLMLRSIPRWQLYLMKLIATFCVTSLMVAGAVAALYAAIYAGTPEFVTDIVPRAARSMVVMILAQAGYCSLFGFLGLFTRRSLIAGIGYIVLIEGILANLDFVGRTLTIVYYVRTLTLRWLDLPAEQLRRCQEAWGMSDLDKLPTATDSVLTVLVFSLSVSILTSLWFARREFRMKTPGSD